MYSHNQKTMKQEDENIVFDVVTKQIVLQDTY